MSATFQIVPWYDVQEWQNVYYKLYVEPTTLETKIQALEDLLVWKARCPSLPSGIESTMTLLEVFIQDCKRENDFTNDHLLRLAMSSAIMRFVNHMLDAETEKGLSFYQAAKNSGIPDWIIELRHNISHSSKLPSIHTLREATSIALHWLQDNYWNKYKECIGNFITGKLIDGEDIEDKIAASLNFCISLGICSHSKCNIKYVTEIKDNSMREALVNEAKYLFDTVDFSNMKLLSINLLIETMYSKSKKLLNNDMISKLVNKVLLSEDSLFLSLELHNMLDNYNLDCSKSLNKQYVECFDVLLNFLHTNDLLQDFIFELIKFTLSDENNDRKCKLASQWLSTLFKALKRNQLFIEKIYETETEDWSSKDKKEIYSLFYHWFPNKRKSLLLDLRKSVPKDLTNMTYIQPIISTYNPYVTYFIKNLLQLIQPSLSDPIINKICKLAKVVASPEKILSSKIYTVEDLKAATDFTMDDDDEIVDKNYVVPEIEEENFIEDSIKNFGIWELASSEYSWDKCPVGQLPWQFRETVESMNV